MNTTGKILVSLAAGAVAGAVLGLLIAPDKGSETRKKILEGKDKVRNNIREVLKKGRERMDGLKEDLAGAVDREEYA
jgi:gas vesicle protein